jgi:hypothetical protein
MESQKEDGEIKRLLTDSSRVDVNGWTYVQVHGDAFQRGFQNGYLLAQEIEDIVDNLKLYVQNAYRRNWEFFCKAGNDLYWPKLTDEYKTEIRGVLAGVQCRKTTQLELRDLLALNSSFDTVSYHYWLKSKEGQPGDPLGRADHCSAFIAAGTRQRVEEYSRPTTRGSHISLESDTTSF